MMKVLYVSSWFPYPPDNGARIRTYNLVKALSKRHEVSLVALLQEDSRRESAVHLEDICTVVSLHESRWFDPKTWKSFVGFFSSRPRSSVDTFDPRIKLAVAEALKRVSPDVLVASPLGAVEYVPSDLRIPSVLDEHDCEYARLQRDADRATTALKRLRLGLSWRKCARWEARMGHRFDAVMVGSEEERQRILKVAPDLPSVTVIPNGVDTEHYTPADREPEPYTLVYNGALTYKINLDAVRYYASEVYPVLARRLPDAKLRVTGRTRGVDLSGIEDCPGIELTGYVDDIRDVLRTSAACVVPLLEGGATRLKVFEAMAAGLPVVSTSMGTEGIDAVPGEHVLTVDTPTDFAAAVEQVLTDSGTAAALSANARRLVEERYSWSAIGESFTELLEQIARPR